MGEGSAQVVVKFRMVVFRPFVGEVLEAKIKDTTEEGIQGQFLLLTFVFAEEFCSFIEEFWFCRKDDKSGVALLVLFIV
jgi:DNA-directed RNA polymerase subunit E'/Rpb7